MHVAGGGRNDYVVESKLRCSEASTLLKHKKNLSSLHTFPVLDSKSAIDV